MEKEIIAIETDKTYNLCFEDRLQEENILNRKLYLNDEIDEYTANHIVCHILRYNHLDAGLPVEERKPILLYINTPGGSAIDGQSIVDAILCSKTPVYTINIAKAESMGFHIFIAGHKRYSFPNAVFLMHDGYIESGNATSRVHDLFEFTSMVLSHERKKYVLERTKIDEQIYDIKYRCEWYFLPDTAKDLGVVDFIVGKDCDIDDII